MARRVLVTRPEPGAGTTARRLAQAGYEPVCLPLTRIVALNPAQDFTAGAWDAVVVTSANAVRMLDMNAIDPLRDIPLLAVGERSGKAAREAGFMSVTAAGGNAEALLDTIGQAMPRGSRLLYLAGRERTEGFEEALVRAGHAVTLVETYAADALIHGADDLAAALGDAPIAAALVHSARGGGLLLEIAACDACAALFDRTRFIAISAKAGAALSARWPDRTFVAQDPDEDAMIALLAEKV